MGKEEYVEVKHYGEDSKVLSKGFYHIKCFKDRLNGSTMNNQLQLKAMQILNRVGSVV